MRRAHQPAPRHRRAGADDLPRRAAGAQGDPGRRQGLCPQGRRHLRPRPRHPRRQPW
nr:hypothetical protein [Nocardioides sp. B-3]